MIFLKNRPASLQTGEKIFGTAAGRGEQIAHVHRFHLFVMRLQFLPGDGFNRVDMWEYHFVFGFE